MKLFLKNLFDFSRSKQIPFLLCLLLISLNVFGVTPVTYAQVDSVGLSVTASNEMQVDAKEAVVIPSYVVVIDAGHGGKDAGIVRTGFEKEKDLVFQIALEIKKKLRKRKRINVFLTRERDITMSLLERVAFANKKEADVFVSLHQVYQEASERKPSLRVFYNQKIRDPYLENIRSKNINAGTKVLPWDLGQNYQLPQSKKLGVFIREAWDEKYADIQHQKYPVRLPLAVLRGIHAPAVLVEIPFEWETQINSEGEPVNDGRRAEIAGCISTGILRFLKNR